MLRHDYSWAERALGFWAPLILGILAVTSLGLRYVADPISCWTPPEFTESMVDYTRHVCFQRKEIYIPFVTDIPMRRETDKTHHQWVPFALGVACILCLFPHVIWRMLSGLLWLDTHSLVQALVDNQRYNAAGRHMMLKDSALLIQAGLRGGNWMLSAAAIGRKALALVVCVLQMILVFVLFRPQLSADEKIGLSHYNGSIPFLEHFICDLPVGAFDHVQRWSIQCFMPLAQVYSKGFTFLFYVFLLLALCCALDILTCISRLAIPGLRDLSLKRYLAVNDADSDPQMSAIMQRFLDSLGLDGRLCVAATADLCGPVAAADLTHHLWLAFKTTSRPGVMTSAPLQGGGPVSPASSGPQSAPHAGMMVPGPPEDPDGIPLLPVGGQGPSVKGAQPY